MRLRAASPTRGVEGSTCRLERAAKPDLGRQCLSFSRSMVVAAAEAGGRRAGSAGPTTTATTTGTHSLLLPPAPVPSFAHKSTCISRTATTRSQAATTTTQAQQRRCELKRLEQAVAEARGAGSSGSSGSCSSSGSSSSSSGGESTLQASLKALDEARASVGGWRVEAAYASSEAAERERRERRRHRASGSALCHAAPPPLPPRLSLPPPPLAPPRLVLPPVAQQGVRLTRAQRREAERVAAIEMVWRAHRNVLGGGSRAAAEEDDGA